MARKKDTVVENAIDLIDSMIDGIPGQQSLQTDYPEALPEPAPEKPAKTKKGPEVTTEKSNKAEMTVFSVWTKKDNIAAWDKYRTITGMTRAELTENAIQAYIKKHPITEEQKNKYLSSLDLV